MRPIFNISNILKAFLDDSKEPKLPTDTLDKIMKHLEALSKNEAPSKKDKSITFSLLHDLFFTFPELKDLVIDTVAEEINQNFTFSDVENSAEFYKKLEKIADPSQISSINSLIHFLKFKLNEKRLYENQFKEIEDEMPSIPMSNNNENIEVKKASQIVRETQPLIKSPYMQDEQDILDAREQAKKEASYNPYDGYQIDIDSYMQ